ncbi:dephospho-CoA kinase [[Haemophilus] ducreyi]|uniref:dephospho-CoA kinase n=1 Tax=Haemophilus ducreyi TaxID=730 RepID=UPI0006565CBF|nr:dephospho-CoA kinase [[Haemophilus] ducreyi]AKO45426.1 dephospho-CoA kinase [[Haemophilus] ducreyi]AKO46812.1 dephospho-CoA kinase [[Haemophilus] ducreyi]AKO48151.1 dephospho-CoA kinase [[Haemophilus] ducreyi]AKO49540.1 dephospho-CoA kinase [[Haemophilus] ducreyi]ANF61420.1 dephospho-CoA kinase [[Haemophilus] ducreyi]
MAFVVGLTGGIASGKTTIANMFAELGATIIDADIVARQVVTKGSPLFLKIVQHFGQQVLTTQGELNRAQLRQLIFANRVEKNWLNNLLHPAIRREMLIQLRQARGPYVLFVVPLLIENKLIEFCQRVLVIDVYPEVQLARALTRDRSNIATIRGIMVSQVNRLARLSYADDIIENNLPLAESLERLQMQVQQLHQYYLTLATQQE